MKTPMIIYKSLVEKGLLKPNRMQMEAAKKLENLHSVLQTYNPTIPVVSQEKTISSKMDSPDFQWQSRQESKSSRSKFFQSLLQSNTKSIQSPRGLYLYGGVGTGKSMLMDLFFETMDVKRKRRVHFHAFMQDIHKRIHQLKEEGITHDPLPIISANLAKEAWLLCFDELQVTNIVDAMLLRRLLKKLFDHGVVMIATSNRHPDGKIFDNKELYQNGIQRQAFIPTIEKIKEKLEVFNLDAGQDYRSTKQEQLPIYFRPLNELTTKKLDRCLEILSNGKPIVPKTLEIWGRKMIIEETCGRVGRTSFHHLCGEPRSSAEFLQIARDFDVLIIKDIPRLDLTTRNEARRFITLIDSLYDSRAKLIASFETNLNDLFDGSPITGAPIETDDRLLLDDLKLSTSEIKSSIFTGAEETFAFQRAISRLREMKGVAWWPDCPVTKI